MDHKNTWNGTNLLQMLQRYSITSSCSCTTCSLQWIHSHDSLHRYFEEQKVEQLEVTELTQLEHQLDAIQRQLDSILLQTRFRKVTSATDR